MAVVVFRSKVSGEVIMMRNHVEPVFKEAGIIFHERGAFLAQDLPSIIASLEQVIESKARNVSFCCHQNSVLCTFETIKKGSR